MDKRVDARDNPHMDTLACIITVRDNLIEGGHIYHVRIETDVPHLDASEDDEYSVAEVFAPLIPSQWTEHGLEVVGYTLTVNGEIVSSAI